jgi:hypothetical protein
VPIEKQETSHYFRDHDVFYWRSDWTKSATAFAFKCGPPEGHHTLAQLNEFPDWRLSSGHAHPDANSFIVIARGQYLTGDTGYAGVPMTEHHNTLLINGKGQAKEGAGHDAFDGVAYERLDRIRIVDVQSQKDRVVLRGDATAAYEPELGVKKFVRVFQYSRREGFTVSDEVETSEPAVMTSLVHADSVIEKAGENNFVIKAGEVKLLVQYEVRIPTSRDSDRVETKGIDAHVEPNVLTAPGPPGAVDKGERQERGEKLVLTTSRPATSAHLVMRMKLE